MTDKIVLIKPANIYNYNNYPPLNLISLGSVLQREGFDVQIINCALEIEPFSLIDKALKDARFVGISMLTSEVADAYKILKHIRGNFDIPIVVGGPHCTLFPEQTAQSQYVDYVVAGEGEEHILQIANQIIGGRPPATKIFPKQILDLENLPIPNYEIDNNIERFITGYLTDKLSEKVKGPMRWLPYESSRGCPSKCTFCINVVTENNRYRKKSAQKVISEIKHIVQKYNISHLKIVDDNFFVDIKRVREIAEGMIKEGIEVTWDAECRCDYFNSNMINDDTLKLFKKAGLVQMTLGIESGSENTLSLMKKEITTQEAEYAVKMCNKYEIFARSSFIIEIPGESKSDIKQTIRFVNNLRKYKFFTGGVKPFRPYPRCELTTKLLDQGLLKEPKSLEEWTNPEVIKLYTAAEYKRPWHVDAEYSDRASFYLNMQSMIHLGNYQIDNRIDRLKNSIFKNISTIRNRLLFYNFPIDKILYQRFYDNFYRKNG